MNDNFLLNQFSHIDGLIFFAVIDNYDGSILKSIGDHHINIDSAILEVTNIYNMQIKLTHQFDPMDYLEGIFISLHNQYHMITPLESNQNLFLYAILDHTLTNPAYARYEIERIEKNLNFYAY